MPNNMDREAEFFGLALSFALPVALVVIDMQVGFTQLDHELGGDLSEEVFVTRRLLDTARQYNVPRVFTVINFGDEADIGLWGEKAPAIRNFREGSPWIKVDPRLAQSDNELVLSKTRASACFETGLVEWLRKMEVASVILCGTSTSGCVRATAVDLFQCDFRVFVVDEGVADRWALSRTSALFDLQMKYAEVVTADTAIKFLKPDWGVTDY